MAEAWFVEEGTRWVSVQYAAELYALGPNFIQELLAHGLFNEVCERSGHIWLAESMLDRLARIRYLHAHLGLQLEALSLWLEAHA